jgi:mitochondrial cardiolipin hydrolase
MRTALVGFVLGIMLTVAPACQPYASAAGRDGSIEGPYFSESDRISDRIVAAINRTRKTLDVAVYDITDPEIAAALEAARRRKVAVRIVTDERQAHGKNSEAGYLEQHGLAVRLSRGYKGNRSIMHDKFAVFDGATVVTGSYNWTVSADRYNYENALFISDPRAVLSFAQEFKRIWSQAH